jgi:cysteine desulfurase
MNKPVYLDYNGTTPHDPQVLAAMKLFLEEEFGNPSSSHWYGIAPKRAIGEARKRVADLLGCAAEEVLFTSGGTESNNHAIIGAAFSNRHKGDHIITSRIEHPAVLEVCKYLESEGFSVTYLPVDEFGMVSVSDVEAAMTAETILITIMHANNEVGTIQPIRQIASLATNRGILVHTDAAQSVGKISTKVAELGVDLLSVAGHKVYAPKGIGALYVKMGTSIRKFMLGAGQESGRRAGTENVTHIVGLGKACEIAKSDLEINYHHMKRTRDILHKILRENVREIRLNGHPEERLPNTLSLSFRDMEANRILEEIGLDVVASAGAACHSDGVQVSHVLDAMAAPLDWAKGTLRFSTGKMTTEQEIHRAAEAVIKAITQLARK